jgi:hypothetical protein
MSILDQVLETVIVQVNEFQRTGQPRPVWLQRKVDSVYSGSIHELIDGLQDELDALNKAEAGSFHG